MPGIQAKNSLESKIGSSETREARWTRRGPTKERSKDDKSPRNLVLDLDKKKLHQFKRRQSKLIPMRKDKERDE